MDQDKNLRAWLLASTAFIILILTGSFFFPFVLATNKSIIDIMAPGRSVSKLYLSEGYIVLLLIICQMSIYFNREKSERNITTSNKRRAALLAGFLISYFLNIVSFFWFITKYHFRISDFIITFKNGSLSSTQFIHNHVFKAIFGFFVQMIHHGPVSNLDTGTAFIGVLPTWFFLLGTVTFVITTILSFTVYYNEIARQPRKILSLISFTLLYGLSTFILLKNIADGGFFDKSTLPALCFLILLLYGKRKYIHSILGIGIVCYAAAVVLVLFSRGNGFINIGYYAFDSILFGWLLFYLYYLLNFQKRIRLSVLIFILDVLLVVYMSYVAAYGVNGPLSYLNESIGPDGAIVASFAPIKGADYTALPPIHKLNLYLYQNKTSSTTIGAIIKKNRLLYTYFPVSMPWQSCVPFKNTLVYEFNLKSTIPISTGEQSWMEISSAKLISHTGGLYSYHVVMLMNGCLPEQLDAISQYFYGIGLKTFFIYDINQGEYEFSTD